MIGRVVPAEVDQFGDLTPAILFGITEVLELEQNVRELTAEGREYESAITESDAVDAWNRVYLSLRASRQESERPSS